MKKIVKELRNSIIIIPILTGLLTSALEDWCNKIFGLSKVETSCIFFVGVCALYAVCFIIKNKKNRFGIQQIEEIVCQKKYFGKALFFIDGEEYNQFEVARQKRTYRIRLLLKRMLNSYPVIYYNVTAKNFLNWIDYIYLDTLKQLEEKINAKIIISLHVDEQLMNESIFREDKRSIYEKKKDDAKKIIQKIIPNSIVVDEFEFYTNAKKSAEAFPEQLISIIVSDINYYVNELSKGSIDYKQFIRYESNVLSMLPILILAKKYKHLFVLDYKSSFDVWNLPPYPDLKKDRKIFFIKCNKIEGKDGERIPSWSENDGINFTDDETVIEEKIKVLDDALISVMAEFFLVDTVPKEQQRRES